MSSKLPSERLSTPETSGRSPVMGTIASARSASSSANAPPTVPRPRTPTRKTGSADMAGHQVVVGLAADDHAGVTVAAEDHGRARQAVVVVGHREAVGPGDRGDDHVAGPRVAQAGGADQHVPGLAV